MKRRFAAAFAALMLLLAGFAIGATSPAFAVPPITNCFPQLTTCGYPTMSTVGPRSGHTLTAYTGVLYTSSNNQVIADLDITGCIVVQNTGVVVHDVKIHGNCFYGIQVTSGDVTASYVDISCVDGVDTGIAFSNYSADHVYIHRCENGIYAENNVSLTNSVVMGYEGAPDISHTDLVQGSAGSNVTISGNLLAGLKPSTSAMIFDVSVSNWTVTNNFMSGGAYELYCPTVATSVTISGNRFYPLGEDAGTKGADARSPEFGYTNGCTTSGITWSSNITDLGGTLNADGTVS